MATPQLMAPTPAPSRLKPVLLHRVESVALGLNVNVGPALAGKASMDTPQLMVPTPAPSRLKPVLRKACGAPWRGLIYLQRFTVN